MKQSSLRIIAEMGKRQAYRFLSWKDLGCLSQAGCGRSAHSSHNASPALPTTGIHHMPRRKWKVLLRNHRSPRPPPSLWIETSKIHRIIEVKAEEEASGSWILSPVVQLAETASMPDPGGTHTCFLAERAHNTCMSCFRWKVFVLPKPESDQCSDSAPSEMDFFLFFSNFF